MNFGKWKTVHIKKIWKSKQHQEKQKKKVKYHHIVLDEMTSSMDLLLEAMNGGRFSSRNGIVRGVDVEEVMNI